MVNSRVARGAKRETKDKRREFSQVVLQPPHPKESCATHLVVGLIRYRVKQTAKQPENPATHCHYAATSRCTQHSDHRIIGRRPARPSPSRLVARYITDTFQIEYAEPGARNLLYGLNFTCSRPTYPLADPEKQKKFKRLPRRQKYRLRHGEIDHMLFEDELIVRNYRAIGRTWFSRVSKTKFPPKANIGEPTCVILA